MFDENAATIDIRSTNYLVSASPDVSASSSYQLVPERVFGPRDEGPETLTDEVVRARVHYMARCLEQLAALKPGWNTYDLSVVSTEAIEAAMSFATSFLSWSAVPLPDVVPTSNGHVQFEWHTNNVELEIQFISASEAEYFFEEINSGKEPEEAVLRHDFRPVHEMIKRLAS